GRGGSGPGAARDGRGRRPPRGGRAARPRRPRPAPDVPVSRARLRAALVCACDGCTHRFPVRRTVAPPPRATNPAAPSTASATASSTPAPAASAAATPPAKWSPAPAGIGLGHHGGGRFRRAPVPVPHDGAVASQRDRHGPGAPAPDEPPREREGLVVAARRGATGRVASLTEVRGDDGDAGHRLGAA